MSDIAKLGIEIETKGADEATRKLSDLEKAAQNAAKGADKLSENAGRADKALQDMSDTAEQAGGAFDRPFAQMVTADVVVRGAAVAVQAFGAAMREGIRAYAEYERATSQLVQSFERVGNTTGFTVSQIQQFSAQLESVTGVAEESIMRIAQVLNRSGAASGAEFQRLSKLSLDLAAAMGGDPVNAAEHLARALKDPERAVSMLRRQFADFDPVIADSIERLAQAGNKAEAAAQMFEYLEQTVGGSAAAATDTLSGAWARFTDTLSDSARAMVEVTGAGEATKTALDAMSRALQEATTNMVVAIQAANDFATGVDDLGKSLLGVEHDTLAAAKATDFLRLAWAAATGSGTQFIATLVGIRAQQAMAAAELAKQQQTVENVRSGWDRLGKMVQQGTDYFRRLGGQISENMKAEAQELALTKMSTAERAKAEAGIAAYEKAKQQLIRATGVFGAAEKAEADRAKEAALKTHELNVQLRAAEQNHGRAGAAARKHERELAAMRKPMEELTKDLEEYIRALNREAELAGMVGVARDKRAAEMRVEEMILRQLGKENTELAAKYAERAKAAVQAADEATRAAEEEQRVLEETQRLQEEGISLFTDFATSIISGSESAGEALGRLLMRLVEIYLQMQLMQSMGGGGGGGGFLGSLLGGIFGGFGGSAAPAGSTPEMWGISRGGAFASGELLPFARGGMVQRPTMRAMALMGEAGPEAVLPLRRDKAGNLGVGADGGDVKVVVQNIDQRKSGAPVETQQSRGQNGEIVIRNYIRDEVRKAMSDGSLDKDFSKNFNLGRNPTRRS